MSLFWSNHAKERLDTTNDVRETSFSFNDDNDNIDTNDIFV